MPDEIWFPPCVVTVTGEGQATTPEIGSSQLKLTVTSALFHPAAFGCGVGTPIITGGVLSRRTVTEAVAVFPARSMAGPDMTRPMVSFVTVTGVGHELIP